MTTDESKLLGRDDELRSLGYSVVDLCDGSYAGFAGFIAPAKTGVVYTNQTAGIGCAHPWIEGAYIPIWLPDVKLENDPLWDVWWGPDGEFDSWDTYPIDRLKRWVAAYEKESTFIPFSQFGFKSLASRAKQAGLAWSGPGVHEAWVPLRVDETHPGRLQDWTGGWGIVTYMNSD